MSERNTPKKDLITWQHSLVSSAERQLIAGQKPLTYWLTGLSGAGKSTLAFALEKSLLERGCLAFTLDGDNLRHGLCKDLGFSPSDRSENIRRVAEVACLMNDAGLVVISSFISPYRDDREMARTIIGAENFVEVHVSTPLSVCEKRDPKGLYQLARNGKVPDFTGVCSPYEEPTSPKVSLDTSQMSLEECLVQLLELSRIRPH